MRNPAPVLTRPLAERRTAAIEKVAVRERAANRSKNGRPLPGEAAQNAARENA